MRFPSAKYGGGRSGFYRVLEYTHAYRLWQAPFAVDKFLPVLRNNDLTRIRRALDVGCGPGINSHYFAEANYTGIDLNPEYIEYARARNKGQFIAADATTYRVDPAERFDFILVNSFFHHVDLPGSNRVLSHLSTLLTDEGHIHILDLVLPERPSLARFLARLDRGQFVRTYGELLQLVEENLEPVIVEPYALKAMGITLWNMVYFKCRRKRGL